MGEVLRPNEEVGDEEKRGGGCDNFHEDPPGPPLEQNLDPVLVGF